MIFEGTNEILRLMIAGQGLAEPGRRLARGVEPAETYGRRVSGAEAPVPMEVPGALQSESLALSMGRRGVFGRGYPGLVGGDWGCPR